MSENMNRPLDYSQKVNWYQIPEVTKEFDTFYVYATEYIMTSMAEGAPEYADMENAEMLEGAAAEYMLHATAYADSTNVFMPYYRQVGLRYAGVVWKRDGIFDAAIADMPYGDIVAALDYYFEHYNNGRPFIIAGHSQGSAIIKMVLKKYFVEHPDYYKRMIAAYPIGYAFTKDEFKTYPHMKFATGECDTGVIITWNTEGPKNREVNADTCVLQPGSMSINPLNWKLDDTYAPASMNLGSLFPNKDTGKAEVLFRYRNTRAVALRGHSHTFLLPEYFKDGEWHALPEMTAQKIRGVARAEKTEDSLPNSPAISGMRYPSFTDPGSRRESRLPRNSL